MCDRIIPTLLFRERRLLNTTDGRGGRLNLLRSRLRMPPLRPLFFHFILTNSWGIFSNISRNWPVLISHQSLAPSTSPGYTGVQMALWRHMLSRFLLQLEIASTYIIQSIETNRPQNPNQDCLSPSLHLSTLTLFTFILFLSGCFCNSSQHGDSLDFTLTVEHEPAVYKALNSKELRDTIK